MAKLLILQAFTCLSVCIAQTQSKSAEAPVSVLNEMRPKTTQSEYPNIVLIYADDLGYGDLSSYGATKIKTPNIDRLAKNGILFTDGHSTSATCTPSRYALLTGEYPLRINNYSPVFCADRLIIDTKKTTIASLLKRKGYTTACVGKWHLGFGDKPKPDWNKELKPGPLELGFDYFFGLPVVNSHPPFVYMENRRILGLDPNDPLTYKRGGKTYGKAYVGKHTSPHRGMPSVIGGKVAHDLYVDELIGEKLTQKALTWMNQQDKPFFLYYASHNVHLPITPHPYFHGKSECGLRGDFVEELDWSVGQIISAVERFGALENTIFIFTSDNGAIIKGKDQGDILDQLGHKPNGKLKGRKFGAWEAGHRVPFIVSWPNKIPAGKTSDALIANLDLLPTFAAITGQKLAPHEARDGFNQLPLLLGKDTTSARSELIIQPHKRSHKSLRQGDWVYIPGAGDGGWVPAKKGELPKQLYNLKDDPYQQQNRINDFPERADAMASHLNKLMKQYGMSVNKIMSKNKAKKKQKQ
ncbi:sulfatase family protein [Lentisphaera araneosa]|uniref:sulfatase family protein n=1 Tax=Lentisphaera araneosa TaxID=256847 RepID=UPI001389EE03|nr:arylsulfatase [Lentisphaera araneosa]